MVRCTMGTLADADARERGIDRTALVVVGRVLGARGGLSHNGAQTESYERSKLYDPSFATGVSEGEQLGVAFEHYIYTGTTRLRCGYTTGSCAALAAGSLRDALVTKACRPRVDRHPPAGCPSRRT